MWVMIASIPIIIGALIFWYYFKYYIEANRKFKILEKILDIRDLTVLKILNESKNKNNAGEIASLIDRRMKVRKSGHTIKMKVDVELNEKLKIFYDEINDVKNNDVTMNIFTKIISLEKKLKKAREEYNKAVIKYNDDLVKNKFVSMRIIKLKPLDTYSNKKAP